MTRSGDGVDAWLEALGTLTAPSMPVDDARTRCRAYAGMLRGKFAASAFTRESLEAVAAGCKWFPAYGELCDLLTAFWHKAPAPPRPAIAGAKAGAGYWHGYIASKLVAGGDRAHLLSLARRYAEPEELRGIIAAFYPAEEGGAEAADRAWWEQRIAGWRAEPPHVELSHLHGAMLTLTGQQPAQGGKCHPRPGIVARVADRIAELEVAGHKPVDLRPVAGRGPGLRFIAHDPAHRATVTTRPDAPEPEKPPIDPHATGRPLTLPEMRARLALFEREAKGNDPPPNAAARIAMLRERIDELSRPKEATA